MVYQSDTPKQDKELSLRGIKMTAKEKAIEYLEKIINKKNAKNYFYFHQYTNEDVAKAIDIALSTQAREIFDDLCNQEQKKKVCFIKNVQCCDVNCDIYRLKQKWCKDETRNN